MVNNGTIYYGIMITTFSLTYPITDIIVGLQAVMISVEEGNTVMVCAELLGDIEIPVEVTIMTESTGSAEGIH